MDPLLRLLQENAAAAPAQLARMLNTSEEEVSAKIKDFEARQVILGYRAILNEEKLDDDIVRAVIEVKITPERGGGFNRLAERIAKYALGVRLGRNAVVVADHRRKLGIAPFTPQPEHRPWTAEEEALLGTMADEKLAPQINRTVRAVIGHRCELGIPAAPRIRQNAWPSERLKLLGTMPDEDKKLVRRLKRTYDAIAMRRQKLNIPPCRPNRWRPEDDRILGTRPDEQVAMLLGRTKTAVRARRCELGKVAWVGERRPPRWTEKDIQLLGKVPDVEAAKLLGISVNSVKLKRRRMGYFE